MAKVSVLTQKPILKPSQAEAKRLVKLFAKSSAARLKREEERREVAKKLGTADQLGDALRQLRIALLSESDRTAQKQSTTTFRLERRIREIAASQAAEKDRLEERARELEAKIANLEAELEKPSAMMKPENFTISIIERDMNGRAKKVQLAPLGTTYDLDALSAMRKRNDDRLKK